MIDSAYLWQCLVLIALGTIAIRFSIIAVSERVVITERTKEIFSFIPAAIVPALIAPSVFFHKGSAAIVMGKERLIVLLVATVISFLTRSTLLTIALGLLGLYLMRFF